MDLTFLTVSNTPPFDPLTDRFPRTLAEAFGGRHANTPLRKTLTLRPRQPRVTWRRLVDAALCTLPAFILGFILGAL